MTWGPGRERIEELIRRGDLERVSADGHLARRLLDDAGRHLVTSEAGLMSGDLAGAYQLAYDALRKSAAALLAEQGLRGTSRGGHVAVQEAVAAQFGAQVRPFRSFGRIRRSRNALEYPDSGSAGATEADVQDALAVGSGALEAARTLLDAKVLGQF